MLELSSRPREAEEKFSPSINSSSRSNSNSNNKNDNINDIICQSSDDWGGGSKSDDREPLLFSPRQQQQQHQPPPPPASAVTSTNTSIATIHRKLCLLAPLVTCLYMLTDSNYYNNNYQSSYSSSTVASVVSPQQQRHHHHLAFVTALSRHPPSLRVFRIVSEGAFLLACAAGALWLWGCAEQSYVTTIAPPPPKTTTTDLSNQVSSFSMRDENYNYNDRDDGEDVEIGKMIRKRIAGEESSNAAVRITSHAVGKLLFAPPSPLAPWRSSRSRLLRLVPNRIHNTKRNRHQRGRIISIVGNGRVGNGSSSGSISSGGSSDASNAEYLKDGSTHSLKRRKNFPTSIMNTVSIGNPKGGEKAVAAIVDDGAMSLPVIAAAAAVGTAAEIQRSDISDDDNDMPTAQPRQQQSSSLSSNTTTTTTTTHPQPPSPVSVLGASLDIITITCIFLIFFTISSAEGGRYIDQASDHVMGQQWMKFIANVAAPLFPLTLFGLSLLAVCIPWKKRSTLWNILSMTWCAPFYPVTFRDGFLGDILTSIVRPLQDLAFTILFVPLGLKAWWSSDTYTMDAAAIPLERSWLLHTVVLPACTLSPLWWRFMQNLRQCYDAKQRWPYLGNALKYLLAAEVSTFGLFNPSVKKSPLWMMCFFMTTLYQVWWDVFMDWGLLTRDYDLGYFYATADRSKWLWWWPYTLRSKRLYKRTWMYHVIFVVNFCLRFVGMITLIPPVYLSRTTGLIVSAYKDPDFQLFVGLFVALAEIFRRTIWALLRLEWEVIKTAPERRTMKSAGRSSSINSLDADAMKPMAIATSGRVCSSPTKRDVSFSVLSDMHNLNDIQILSELCVWATVFSGIAIIAAAHREVL